MVVLNLVVGVCLRLLSAYKPIFDLINLAVYLTNNTFEETETMSKWFLIICSYNHECYTFEKLGNMLYLSSFSVVFIFYSAFDKWFKCALGNVLPWKNQDNKTKQNQKI